MALDRRAFLKRCGIGVSAALLLASLPEAAVKALTVPEAARLCACEYLRKVYNQHARGRQHPRRMEVGRELFEAFEGELMANQRFCASEPEADGLFRCGYCGLFGEPGRCESCGGPNQPAGYGGRQLMFKGAMVYPVGRGWYAKVAA